MANISEDSVAYGMHAHTSSYMTANMYTHIPIYIHIDIPTYANTRTYTDAEKKARRRENKASAALRL